MKRLQSEEDEQGSLWKPVFAHDALSGPSASGDEGPVWWVDAHRSFLPICSPPGFLLSFQQLLAETSSNLEALEPLSSVFPRPGPVSCRSFPALTPCPGFPVMVCLLAVAEGPRQGGGRTQARGGWARVARKTANDCQSTKSFTLTSKVLPSPGTKLKVPLGSSRDRHPWHHPSQVQGGRGASFQERFSSLQPWQPRTTPATLSHTAPSHHGCRFPALAFRKQAAVKKTTKTREASQNSLPSQGRSARQMLAMPLGDREVPRKNTVQEVETFTKQKWDARVLTSCHERLLIKYCPILAS